MIVVRWEITHNHRHYHDLSQLTVQQVTQRVLITDRLKLFYLSGSSTPRQIPRDNIISSLHNSINDLSYSVEPVQKKSTVESYRAIKDKVQKAAKPADLPNGQLNTPSPRQAQKSFRFEKKSTTPTQETKKPPRRCKTSMDFVNTTSFRSVGNKYTHTFIIYKCAILAFRMATQVPRKNIAHLNRTTPIPVSSISR